MAQIEVSTQDAPFAVPGGTFRIENNNGVLVINDPTFGETHYSPHFWRTVRSVRRQEDEGHGR